MNARLYDPYTGRMLSPDNYVGNAQSSQAYNRYSYANNNPLRYTDPTGNFMFAPILIGALIGGASYTLNVALSDGGFKNWNWGAFITSVGIGAISGAASAGIGEAFGAVGSFGHEVLRAVAHGSFSGYLSLMTNGDFLQGFASGAFGSLGSSAFGSVVGTKIAHSTLGTVAFGALSGGIGAALSGGDFWQGAGTGATIALLNHAAHRVLDGPGDPPGKKGKRRKNISTSSNNKSISFFNDNWKDMTFLANDASQLFIDTKTTLKISAGYKLIKSTVKLPLGLATRVNTKALGYVSTFGRGVATAAPWVAVVSVTYNAISNQQVTYGDIYQLAVTGTSTIPGFGLIVGGGAILAEGISYYFTGRNISENINMQFNNRGIIYSWK